MNFNHINYSMRRLVSGLSLSPRRLDFCSRAVHAGFVVAKVAQRQVLLQVIPFSSANYNSTIAPYPFIMWGWTMGPLKATVPQRHCLTPP